MHRQQRTSRRRRAKERERERERGGKASTVRHLSKSFHRIKISGTEEWPRNPRGNYFSKATYRGAHEEVIGQKIRSHGPIMAGREQRGPRAPYPSLSLSFSSSFPRAETTTDLCVRNCKDPLSIRWCLVSVCSLLSFDATATFYHFLTFTNPEPSAEAGEKPLITGIKLQIRASKPREKS